ncbi:MAG: 5'/3'-nucleotidase SurE, partial [archaeon]|nr:5'/3'-nucleotidase SurE [archaeon]
PDLVISGINTGFNIGKGELTTSGTLGAAFESASFSIPTIAVSQAVSNENTKFENGEVNIDFSFAEKQLNRIAKTVLKKGLPEGVDLINVNIPANPSDDEIEIVRLCDRMYNPFVEERKDLRGVPYYWIEGNLCKYEELDTDGYVLNIKQRTTITPLIIDLTTDLDKIKKWFI